MESKVTKGNENLVSIELTIPASEASVAYNSASKRIAQHVRIDGFRPGKAPRAVIERHVGIDRIKYEALDSMLPKYLSQAIYDNKLDLITQPSVKSFDFEVGQDVKVVLEAETRPEVSMGSYKDLSVKVEVPKHGEDTYDKAMENFLTQHSSMELVLDRPSSETDTVVFDFEGKVGDELIQGGSAKGYTLDLAHSNFIPGFAEQLVGHNIKEEFDINVTFPVDYHDEKLKGQPAIFSIKLNEIKQRVLPELTDDFVKKSSKFSTVEELKADIKSYVDTQFENVKKANAENTIFKTVVDASSVNIPQSMISREMENLKAEYQQRLAYQGLNWDEFVKSQGKDFEQQLTADATTRIKNSLVIDSISKEIDVKVGQADLQSKISQIAMSYGLQSQDVLKQFGQNPNFLTSLSQQIVNDKVREYLVNNNNVEYVEVEEKETVNA